MLPSKWLKPVVKSGVLPVHAQTSITRNVIALGGGTGGINGGFYWGEIDAYVVEGLPPGLLSASGWGVGSQSDLSAENLESIPDIPVTMDYQVYHNAVGNPIPDLPRTRITDILGVFFDAQFFYVSDDWSFRLVFTAPGCNPGYSPTFSYDDPL
jgi:hypothetical protein